MAREWRYALRRGFPQLIRFRDEKTIALEIVRSKDSYVYQWELRARRLDGGSPVHLCGSCYSRSHLEKVMFSEGFGVERHSSAERFMRALERAGHAVYAMVKR
jgi:hypothetical protein